MLVEQLEYNLLFRWFVGLPLNERRVGCNDVYEESRSSLGGGVAQRHLSGGARAKRHRRLDEEQFSVDATLIEAWA